MKNVIVNLVVFVFLFINSYGTIISGLIIYSDRESPTVYINGKKSGQLSGGIFRKSFKIEKDKSYEIELKDSLSNGKYYYYHEKLIFSENLEKIINAKMELVYTDEYFTELVKKNPNSLFSYSQYIKNCPNGKYKDKFKKRYDELKAKYEVPENYVLVEGGNFDMGNDFGVGDRDEFPKHSVVLNYDYYVSKYELSQREYKELTGYNPSYFNESMDNPVENVSWWEAIKYCNLLSKKDGLALAYNENTGEFLNKDGKVIKDVTEVAGYRLPTEAEWEYAAIGGAESLGTLFSGGNSIDDVAWYNYNSEDKSQKIGQLRPNELGIFDMSGNVLEWCTDSFQTYSKKNLISPYISGKVSSKVCRGGSWRNVEDRVRVKDRNYNLPWDRLPYLGFRVARTAIPE